MQLSSIILSFDQVPFLPKVQIKGKGRQKRTRQVKRVRFPVLKKQKKTKVAKQPKKIAIIIYKLFGLNARQWLRFVKSSVIEAKMIEIKKNPQMHLSGLRIKQKLTIMKKLSCV